MIFLILACQSSSVLPIDDIVVDFQAMHRSVYDVYSLQGEPQAIHQLLAKSFSGEALTNEYIEHFTTLFHMEEEETDIVIKQVDYNDIEPLEYETGRVVLDVDWSVGGIVTHQKHKHTRVNRYRAVYTLDLKPDQAWRIIDTKMRNMERIRRATDEDLLNGENAGGGYLDPLDLLDAGLMEQMTPKKDEDNKE